MKSFHEDLPSPSEHKVQTSRGKAPTPSSWTQAQKEKTPRIPKTFRNIENNPDPQRPNMLMGFESISMRSSLMQNRKSQILLFPKKQQQPWTKYTKLIRDKNVFREKDYPTLVTGVQSRPKLVGKIPKSPRAPDSENVMPRQLSRLARRLSSIYF